MLRLTSTSLLSRKVVNLRVLWWRLYRSLMHDYYLIESWFCSQETSHVVLKFSGDFTSCGFCTNFLEDYKCPWTISARSAIIAEVIFTVVLHMEPFSFILIGFCFQCIKLSWQTSDIYSFVKFHFFGTKVKFSDTYFIMEQFSLYIFHEIMCHLITYFDLRLKIRWTVSWVSYGKRQRWQNKGSLRGRQLTLSSSTRKFTLVHLVTWLHEWSSCNQPLGGIC